MKIYQHFKGGLYAYVCSAKIEQTLESVAVYRSLETGDVWVRPVAEFNEVVTNAEGSKVSRFSLVPSSTLGKLHPKKFLGMSEFTIALLIGAISPTVAFVTIESLIRVCAL